jgi:hypothetical protein
MRGSSLDREAVEAEIDRVRSLGFDELRALWRRTFRSSPPSAFTKDLVARFICWHLQEQDIKSMRSSHPCSRISHCRAHFAGYGFRDLSHQASEVQVKRPLYLVGEWIGVSCHDLTQDREIVD